MKIQNKKLTNTKKGHTFSSMVITLFLITLMSFPTRKKANKQTKTQKFTIKT